MLITLTLWRMLAMFISSKGALLSPLHLGRKNWPKSMHTEKRTQRLVIRVSISELVSYLSDDDKPLEATAMLREIWWSQQISGPKLSSMHLSFWLISVKRYLHINADTVFKKAAIKINYCQIIANGLGDCMSANAFHLSTRTVYKALKRSWSVLFGLQTSAIPKSCPITYRLCTHMQISVFRHTRLKQ